LKNHLRNTKTSFHSFSLLVVLLLAVTIQSSAALNYTINFTALGVTNSVDSVQVQNLTKGTTVTVTNGNTLTLTDQTEAVIALSANDAPLAPARLYRVGKW